MIEQLGSTCEDGEHSISAHKQLRSTCEDPLGITYALRAYQPMIEQLGSTCEDYRISTPVGTSMANRTSNNTSSQAVTRSGNLRQNLKGAPRTRKKEAAAPYQRKTLNRKTLSAEDLQACVSMPNLSRSPPPTSGQHSAMDATSAAAAAAAAVDDATTTRPTPSTGYDMIMLKLDQLNSNQNVTNASIADLSNSLTGLAGQVSTHTSLIASMQQDIDKLQRTKNVNHAQDIDKKIDAAVKASTATSQTILDDRLEQLLNKKLQGISKDLDKVRAVQAVQAQTNAKLLDPKTSVSSVSKPETPSIKEKFEDKYWSCRSSIRIWPVDSSTDAAMWAGVGDFFFDKLQIPRTSLPQEGVDSIQRVMPGRKKKKIENEVIVRFNSVQLRDMVTSYAPNLRQWREKDGSANGSTGLRLEIPDHLMAVFKTLERYGHFLKDKHKEGLRRHIRFEDYEMTLVMDYALPGEDVWQRIEYENAREELRVSSYTSRYVPFSSSSTSDLSETPKAWGVPDQPSRRGTEQQQEDVRPEEEEEEMQQGNHT